MLKVNSPCVKNCCLNNEDICLGCFRSLDEIVHWAGANNEEKENILKLSIIRKEQHHNKYGGN